jgi:uncharacterized protein (DUF983 family)
VLQRSIDYLSRTRRRVRRAANAAKDLESMATERWEPDRSTPVNPWPMPPLLTAIRRGLRGHCPGCGKGRIFEGFLKVAPACHECGAPLGLARADDAPPYFTILLVGHIVIPLVFLVERLNLLPLPAITAIFVPLTLLLTMAVIRPVKGGTVGLMLNLNMLKSDPTAL